MYRMQRVAIGLVIWVLTFAAAAQQPIFYPAKGQSAQKQNTDTAECQLWAKQTTGVDPVAIAQQSGQPGAAPKQGGAVRGAAGGAAVGAVGGAIGGNAGTGTGAAIGAATGAMVGGVRQRRNNQAAAQQQQAAQQQVSQQMATFNRAVGACMSGRGYSVK